MVRIVTETRSRRAALYGTDRARPRQRLGAQLTGNDMRHATDAEIAMLTDLGPIATVHGEVTRTSDEWQVDNIALRLMTLRDATRLAAECDKLANKVRALETQLEAARVAKSLDIDRIIAAIRDRTDDEGALHFDAMREILAAHV